MFIHTLKEHLENMDLIFTFALKYSATSRQYIIIFCCVVLNGYVETKHFDLRWKSLINSGLHL